MNRLSAENRYYVYVVFRLDGSPCYVGKGCKRRWLQHQNESHNPILARIIAKSVQPLPVVKIRTGLTNDEACVIERAFIAAVGRLRNGGTLVNLTDGGEGAHGRVLSAESRAKIGKGGETRKGRKYGNYSPERCAAVSAGRKGQKPSPEWRAAVSKTKKGKPKSPEWRQAIAKAQKEAWERRKQDAAAMTEWKTKNSEQLIAARVNLAIKRRSARSA